MKKIICLLGMLMMIGLVSAWGADRVISGNQITINIDETGGTGIFTIQETASGITITNFPSNCGLAGNVLTCDSDDASKRIIIYQTSGSGSISGVISGGFPSSQKTITGNTQIGDATDTTPPTISNVQATASVNSATITWSTNENSNSTIYFGATNSLESQTSNSASATSHSIILTGLQKETKYYYKVNSCDSSNNCVNSSVYEFTTLASNLPANDDFMVNYIRGVIIIDGVKANAGTQYKIEVLNGNNADYVFTGAIDSEIPNELKGKGYFDSRDQIKFSTGDSFKVSLINYPACSVEGVFANGGNGDFERGNLANINCQTTPSPHAPILNSIGNKIVAENSTLQFSVSATHPDGDTNLTYNVVGLPAGASFTNQIFNWIPNLNQSGSYSVTFNVKDSKELSDSETINILVNEFGEQPSFPDADTCSVFDNNINVDIKDPRDGDNFENGENMNVKVKIENDADKEVNLKVTAYLYNLDSNKVVESEKNSVKISSGKSKNVEFTIAIPDDADDSDDFAVYVIAMKSKSEFCNSAFANVDVEKPKKKIVIKDFEISPTSTKEGGLVSFSIDVKNIGEDDLEDVYAEIKNSELGLNLKSEKFNIDSGDSETMDFEFTIPDNVGTEKNYEIEASVLYNGDSDDELGEIYVSGESNRKIPSSPQKIGLIGDVIKLDSETIGLNGNSKKIGISSEQNNKEDIPNLKVNLSYEEESGKKIGGFSAFSLSSFSVGKMNANSILLIGILLLAILVVIAAIVKIK